MAARSALAHGARLPGDLHSARHHADGHRRRDDARPSEQGGSRRRCSRQRGGVRAAGVPDGPSARARSVDRAGVRRRRAPPHRGPLVARRHSRRGDVDPGLGGDVPGRVAARLAGAGGSAAIGGGCLHARADSGERGVPIVRRGAAGAAGDEHRAASVLRHLAGEHRQRGRELGADLRPPRSACARRGGRGLRHLAGALDDARLPGAGLDASAQALSASARRGRASTRRVPATVRVGRSGGVPDRARDVGVRHRRGDHGLDRRHRARRASDRAQHGRALVHGAARSRRRQRGARGQRDRQR